MKVDPEKLEQEADELLKQMMAEHDGPEEQPKAEETDTPPQPHEDENPPAESADTGEDGEEIPQEEDRGDQDPDESEGDLQQQIKLANERIKNAQARMTKATQEAADLRKEVIALRQHNAELSSELANAQNGRDGEDDDLKTLAEEYPDIAAPLLKKLAKLEQTVTQYRDQVRTNESQSTLTEHFDTIRESHPDMDDIVTSDDFVGWLERQTPVWQRVANDGSAHEVVELINRYKEVFDTQPQQPVSKVDKARRVAEPTLPKARRPDPSSGKRIWSRQEITRMPLDEFERRSAEIDQAYLDGRVR